MSKVTITPLRQATGVYGTVRAHEPVQVERKLADQLLRSPHWVEGVSDVAKARQQAVAQRVAEEDAARVEAEKVAAEKAEAERLAAEKAEAAAKKQAAEKKPATS